MKSILTKTLGVFFILFFISFSVLAQESGNTVLVEEAKELALDEKINNAFAPVTKWAMKIVFYAIPLKKTIDQYEVTKEGDKTLKYYRTLENAPFEVVPDWKSKYLSNGHDYSITPIDGENYSIKYQFKDEKGDTYEYSNTYAFGQEVEIKEGKFKVNKKGDFAVGKTYTFKANQIALPIVLIVLLLGALFFTVYFRFVNITKFKLAIDTVRGKYDSPSISTSPDFNNLNEGDNPDTIRVEGAEEGEVTHFQALTAALSATVGLGNIAGVAIAIALGGPGATFWMIIGGLLGMSSKFAECTLGVRYREIGPDGTVYGGPMYYLSKGLKEKGMAGVGKVFAAFFAIMCVGGSFGGGNMFQANQAASQFLNTFGMESGMGKVIFGVIIAVLVGIVIIGGIKRIGSVTEKVVPFMAGIYVLSALVILVVNLGELPNAVSLILTGAFSPMAVAGGFIGVLIQGFKRAAFSNEAGVGSAAIAHSAVKTKYPASEGIVALLEPFIDTVVICTMTALVIIVTGNYLNPEGLNGVDLTSQAFNGSIPGFKYVLTVAVVLFAFSSMLSWSYYGLQAWKYLFGKSKAADILYKVLFCIFVVIGSAATLGNVTDFSDAMVFAMIFPNIIGVILLVPVIKEELKKYEDDIKNGVIETVK